MTAEPVPAGPVTIEPPEHPLHALTTYELSRYRRELEHALKTLPSTPLSSSFSGGNSPRCSPSRKDRVVIAEASA